MNLQMIQVVADQVFHSDGGLSRRNRFGEPVQVMRVARPFEFIGGENLDQMCQVEIVRVPENNQLLPGPGVILLGAHPVFLIIGWKFQVFLAK